MQITLIRVTTGTDKAYGDKPFSVEHVMNAEIPIKDLHKFTKDLSKMMKGEKKRSIDRIKGENYRGRGSDEYEDQFNGRFEV